MNWEEACQVLGIPTTATPAEIHTQYIYKAQLLHPDKTAGYPDKVRQKAEEELKQINAAYSVLKDPKNNILAIPPKLRVTPGRIRFKDVGEGQKKTTSIKIESIGGAYTKFWMEDAPAAWLKVIEVKSTTNDPLPLEATIEATGVNISQKQSECNLPIRIENEKNKTRDEVSVKIQLAENKKEHRREIRISRLKIEGVVLAGWQKALLLVSGLSVAGLVAGAFIKSLIPFWLLLSFSVLFLVEKWFGNPAKKHKTVGIFYRLVLNVGILSYLGFTVWSGVRLFSQHFMRTPLIGSMVFLGECAFFLWLWLVVRKNSWRWPSMKLTVGALIVAFLVFSYAGVQPFATYKDEGFSSLNSFFNGSAQ